jgi:cytidylate kinase
VTDLVRTVTIGGLAGTGTSTLARSLHERTGLPYLSGGQIFRDAAAARGLSLADFGRLCETDPAVDRELDDRQVELLRAGGLVLESRLAGWLAYRHQLPALKVWVVCDDGERIRRIADREGGDVEAQRRRTRDREASERRRYRAWYGIDLAALDHYDLVLDSTTRVPDDLAGEIVGRLEAPPRT